MSRTKPKERATEPLVYPSVLFSEKMVFDDGEQRVELTKVGPAHSAGDAVAYLPAAKVLFVGDLAVNWIYGNNVSDVDADIHNWVTVLGRLTGWINTVIPGHGVPGTVETLRGQRDYLQDMLQGVEAGIKAGKTADQLADEINLSKYQPFAAEPKRTAGQIVHVSEAGAAGREIGPFTGPRTGRAIPCSQGVPAGLSAWFIRKLAPGEMALPEC